MTILTVPPHNLFIILRWNTVVIQWHPAVLSIYDCAGVLKGDSGSGDHINMDNCSIPYDLLCVRLCVEESAHILSCDLVTNSDSIIIMITRIMGNYGNYGKLRKLWEIIGLLGNWDIGKAIPFSLTVSVSFLLVAQDFWTGCKPVGGNFPQPHLSGL